MTCRGLQEWRLIQSSALVYPQEEIDTINNARKPSLPSPQLARVMSLASTSSSSVQTTTATVSVPGQQSVVGDHQARQPYPASVDATEGNKAGMQQDSPVPEQSRAETGNITDNNRPEDCEAALQTTQSNMVVTAGEGTEGDVGESRAGGGNIFASGSSSSVPGPVSQQQGTQLSSAIPRTRGSYIPLAVARAAGARQAEYLQQLQVRHQELLRLCFLVASLSHLWSEGKGQGLQESPS